MPHFRVELRERHKLLLLLLAGAALSVWFMGNAGEALRETVQDSGAVALEYLAQITAMENRIVWSRVGLPILWIALSFTAWGGAALYLSWMFLGFSLGTLLWFTVSVSGWRGPFLFWGLVFPQYLCYVPALLLLYVGCLRWYTFWRECRRTLPAVVLTPQMRMFVVRIFLGSALYGLGIWLEITGNPWILEKIFIKS